MNNYNKLFLTGKVLNCYIAQTGALIVKLTVLHEHKVGKQVVSVESVFNTIMVDDDQISVTDVQAGDVVNLVGYIKLDHKKSLSGNDHQFLKIYASSIEVVKRK